MDEPEPVFPSDEGLRQFQASTGHADLVAASLDASAGVDPDVALYDSTKVAAARAIIAAHQEGGSSIGLLHHLRAFFGKPPLPGSPYQAPVQEDDAGTGDTDSS